ncbi:acetyl-CoA C-acyltransferase [Nocardia seriolae]|uniref:Acetyl-CoA C-acetyltransferase n=1 Tax=Nocardia seriolae TaxID=37332 RepID=A0A0B8NF43_9NOCA|nr:acetyl-CoA C-acyltransferase [Nocardia seriolae]APA99539.1 Acetyl-CoA C-acetyltransferase [Nocardia seriolae]MTJ63081.1 acetyl-CoA C-acyltransferase [Nocardia seriolae]MTJ73314.1 acetyl-CoA C-acyltransferase [Nocardia seriolae]MTJ89112.1 acetyl-CoA C-acyltransferase [Nocardia seriolae]MTK33090.1 acetyl-CoA C-acyltransferase [Nocardia seriolae]
MTEAFVYDAVRLPRGRVRKGGGTLAEVPPYELLGQLLVALEERGCPSAAVDDVLVGVSTAVGEQGGDIARAAAIWAGWPDSVPGAVVSRLCCSGLDAVESGAARVAAGFADLVVAGGVESMSRVPMLADRPAIAVDADLGERTGFVTIGVSADLTAAEYGITRAELDAFAVRSHRKASAAVVSESLIPVRKGESVVLAADEGARPDACVSAFAALPTLFGADPAWERVARRLPGAAHPVGGLHTIATAPQLADGASALLLGNRRAEQALGRPPVAQIVGTAQTAVRSPLLSAPISAARVALRRAGISAADLDGIEVNESFAVTPLLLRRELSLDPARVNPSGGAMAVGHPLGATGGILLVSALDELRRRDGEFALIAIPAALGLGSATVLRRIS